MGTQQIQGVRRFLNYLKKEARSFSREPFPRALVKRWGFVDKTTGFYLLTFFTDNLLCIYEG